MLLGLFLAMAGSAAAQGLSRDGDALLWVALRPSNDARNPDMRAHDEEWGRRVVKVANTSGEFEQKFKFEALPIRDLLKKPVPFTVLCWDPVVRMDLTEEEKKIIQEYLSRGGFMLLVENFYAYDQDAYRKADMPRMFEFFTKELPKRDPKFYAEEARDTHPIFRQLFTHKSDPAFAREASQNPNYRGGTILLYNGEMVGCVFGYYGYDDGEQFLPAPRPYTEFELTLESYKLLLNVYVYAATH